MRVVFDSNIYISAFVTPSGQAGQALLKILGGTDILLISKPIFDEVLATLAGKFGRDAEALSRTAFLLGELAEIVKPDHRLDVLEDEPDNRVLECAEAGQADCIVTGDKAMLRLKQYEGIHLIPLREYLAGGE